MTCPDHFKHIHLDHCESTSDYIRQNLSRLEIDFPLMVSAAAQLSGRGRDGRGWFSAPGLGLYATFAFRFGDVRGLPLLSIASGVAVCDMLSGWTGMDFGLKWPNDVLGQDRKVAGILCENMVAGEKITCLVGIGVNVNQRLEDFPPELRRRAASLFMLTGAKWPVEKGRERLVASMAAWLRRAEARDADSVLGSARALSRSFLGREISFRQQGRIWYGVYRGLAADGGLLLETPQGREKVFYSGEIID